MALDIEEWPVACACGRAYTQEQWTTLRLVGAQDDEDAELEMRVCVCGSTISVTVRRRAK
jgi:hypothetical protein